MDKNTIYFNESAYNTEAQTLEQAKASYQELLNELTKLKIKVGSMADLANLAADGAIKQHIEQNIEAPVIAGLQVSREKAVALLDIDFPKLNELALRCSSFYAVTRYLTLSGKEIKADKEALKESHTLSATSSKQKQLVQAHADVATTLSKLNELLTNGMEMPIRRDDTLKRLFSVNDEGQFTPSEYFYQQNVGKFNALK